MTGDDQPTEPADHQTGRPRGTDGRYVSGPETAERDAQAAELRGRGWPYRRIAGELGYASHTSAIDAVSRALAAIRAEPAADVKQLELERLDRLWEAAIKVLERRHVHVSGGKVVTQVTAYVTDDAGAIVLDEEGRPLAKSVAELEDDGPVLAAIDRLVKIQQRRAALLGLDEPVKAQVGGKLTYEILGVDLDALK